MKAAISTSLPGGGSEEFIGFTLIAEDFEESHELDRFFDRLHEFLNTPGTKVVEGDALGFIYTFRIKFKRPP